MRVLVTGGAGFIGSAVVDHLVADRHDVVVLDSLHPGAHRRRPDYLNPAATYHWGDVRDASAVEQAVAGVDAVSHQAAMVGLGVDFADAPAYVSHNDTGTAVLLGVLHDRDFAGRLVVASSMVVYGEGVSRCPEHGTVRPATRTKRELDAGRYEPTCPLCGASCRPEPVTESAPLDPRNVYAATKLHQEHLCAAFGREHDATVVALRYHNVYGPRMPRDTPYAGVASIFRSAAERGEAPQVLEDGRQRRDFIEVSDVARANVAALTIDEGGSGADNSYSTYNVCSGEPHTVLDMADALIASIPGAAPAKVVGGYRLGDVRHVFASPEKARAELGFRARVGFREGMARFAAADLRT